MGAPFLFGSPMPNANTGADLVALRRKITKLVARNAISMVQNAIDAVNEGGQHQTIKYLFEMIGLFPAVVGEDVPEQESLAQRLLESLGMLEVTQTQKAANVTGRQPVE